MYVDIHNPSLTSFPIPIQHFSNISQNINPSDLKYKNMDQSLVLTVDLWSIEAVFTSRFTAHAHTRKRECHAWSKWSKPDCTLEIKKLLTLSNVSNMLQPLISSGNAGALYIRRFQIAQLTEHRFPWTRRQKWEDTLTAHTTITCTIYGMWLIENAAAWLPTHEWKRKDKVR